MKQKLRPSPVICKLLIECISYFDAQVDVLLFSLQGYTSQVSDLCACIKEPVDAGFARHGFLQSETWLLARPLSVFGLVKDSLWHVQTLSLARLPLSGQMPEKCVIKMLHFVANRNLSLALSTKKLNPKLEYLTLSNMVEVS